MSLETVARQSLYRQTRARGGELRSLADRRLLSRIWRFAQRHHRKLAVFLAVSVVSALLTVATPLLAGRVVDEITGPGVTSVVVMLAAVIAVVAVAEAGVALVTRWLSATIGEGLILDLRTAVFDHVALLGEPTDLAADPASARGGNLVVVASDLPLSVPALDEAVAARDTGWMAITGDELARWVGDAQVLTDDHAPVDQLPEPFGSRP